MEMTTNLVPTKDRGGPSARDLVSSQHSEQQIYNLRNNPVVLRGPGWVGVGTIKNQHLLKTLRY